MKGNHLSPKLAWTISGSVCVFCIICAFAALWIFDVIDLPGLGRFDTLIHPASGSSAGVNASSPSTFTAASALTPRYPAPSLATTSDDQWNQQMTADSTWPEKTGAKSVNMSALSKATSDFSSLTGSPVKASYLIANGDGTMVASSNAHKLLEPASTMKMLTTLAATRVLDLSKRLPTDVFLLSPSTSASPVASSKSASDVPTLVIRGGGDMLLGAGTSDPTHVNGRAGLATLTAQTVAALRHQGIHRVKLVSDTTLFGPVRRPKIMSADYVQTGFFAPTSALAVDEGRTTAPGDPDSMTHITYPRASHPATAAVEMFADQLIRAGVKLTNNKSGAHAYIIPAASKHERDMITASAKGATHTNQKRHMRLFTRSSSTLKRIGRVESAPLSEILQLMLTISDNTLAEEFGRLTALALGTGNSPDGAVKAVETELAKSHISLEKGHIADCSGLSPGSRLTASVLFHVIRYLRENANADALRGLPVVLDGKPVYSHDAAGRVRLKTGSLDTVSSVCGIILRKNGGFFYYTGIANVPDGWTKAGGYTALHTLANALVDL